MASLTPSAYKERDREDGGPFLLLLPNDNENSVDVFFTDVSPEQRTPDSPVKLLINVSSDQVMLWPLNVRPDKDDYLSPKYGSLERIIITCAENEPYLLPETVEDVVELLEQLPEGFAKDYRFGLGLKWEYRLICQTAASVSAVTMMFVHGGDETVIDPPFFILGIKQFHRLRKEINNIASRYQREARSEKGLRAYHDLLHAADPLRFPRKVRKLRPGALADRTNDGRDRTKLAPRDRHAVVQMVKDNVRDLVESEPDALFTLKSEIELISLARLIEHFEEMLNSNKPESKWQKFLTDNPFILSLAFSIPAILVQGQAYVGGKKMNGRDGKITDFIYASASTGNLALVEIKKPNTELLNKTAYRGDDVFTPSLELSGTITQLLDQRFQLQKTLPIIKESTENYHIHSYAVRCIAIIGSTPADAARKKSLELIRNAFHDVSVITFDELLNRLKEIRNALSPAILSDKGGD